MKVFDFLTLEFNQATKRNAKVGGLSASNAVQEIGLVEFYQK